MAQECLSRASVDRWGAAARLSIGAQPPLPRTPHTHIDSPPLPFFQPPSPPHFPADVSSSSSSPLEGQRGRTFLFFSFFLSIFRHLEVSSGWNRYFFVRVSLFLFSSLLFHSCNCIGDFFCSFVYTRYWGRILKIFETFPLPFFLPLASLIVSPLCNLFRLPSHPLKSYKFVFVFSS